MVTRRGFLTAGGLGLLGLGVRGDDLPEGPGGEDRIPDGAASKGMMNARTEAAVARGLAYLRSHSDRDGAFGTGGYRGNVAVTALAGMAFMCSGAQPGRGPYGRVVQDAIRFILGKENVTGRNPGFLHNPAASPHGPMYGHGFATLFLSEAYGMVHDRLLREELRTKLRLAIGLILTAQRRNGEGAWRYEPSSADADLSVTICQIMAMRSARNAGIGIPKKAVDLCTAYVKACQDRREGWFRYMKRGSGGGGAQGFARTAAGVCALNAAGIYKGPEVEEGLRFLSRNKPAGRFGRPDLHYFYGHYYAVQAMWTAGGTYWNEWYPAIRDELLDRQNADGSWVDQICGHYGTAMACIILQVPNNYLPILQK
ncbi:MAG: prenyltransferase/squalene oxidase repeat-containing protein [Gemmataceae bacterium]